MARHWQDFAAHSTATTGTGTITLGSALSGYKALEAAADGKRVYFVIKDGLAKETSRGVYTHSGTTLTRELIDSTTGALLNLSGSGVEVYIDWVSTLAKRADAASAGAISGGILARSSVSAITVSACTIALDGVLMSSSGTTTLTGGSTMTDLAGSAVTLAADSAYLVFAFNNSGTLAFRVEQRDGTGDGADPVFDADADYWKAASTGVAARRIGKFFTDGSANIIAFTAFGRGRDRGFICAQGPALVSNGTATSFTSLTMTPFISTGDETMFLATSAKRTTTGGTVQVLLAIDGGTNNCVNLKGYINTSGLSFSLGNQQISNSGTLHYQVAGGGGDTTININGLTYYV